MDCNYYFYVNEEDIGIVKSTNMRDATRRVSYSRGGFEYLAPIDSFDLDDYDVFSFTDNGYVYDSVEPTEGMDFGDAIRALKNGKRVARRGWNGRGIFIELQVPDCHSKMTHPYIYIDTTGLQTNNQDAPKNRVPWLASQTDMLSTDWYIVE